MKKTDPPRHGRILFIGIIIVIFSAIGAGLKGTADGRSDARVRSHCVQTDGTSSEWGTREKFSGGDPTISTEKIHQRLWKIWRESPDPGNDPEAYAKIGRLLATMSSAQVEEFLRSLPPGLSHGPDFRLSLLVLQAWVLQDGPAALTYIGTGKDAKININSLVTSQLTSLWVGDEPDAAFAWMNDESLPPELKKKAARLRRHSLMNLMDTNQDRAFQELSQMEPEAVSEQLKLWAGTHGTKPEVREKLLEHAARTGTPEATEEILSILMRVLSEKDPAAAQQLIDSRKATADPAALELAATVGRASKEPKATFDEWLEKNDVSAGIPEPIMYGIGSWMWNKPEEALKWLEDQPAGEKRDTLYADSIPALAGFEYFGKAAQIAAAIESPDRRASALQALDLRWSLMDHDAVEKWRQNLSPEDRTLLGK